jgi:DNA invertase Pin-like site-specific DNA recombinase
MRAAIYARGSTHNGQDTSLQTRELRDYLDRRGWQLAGEYVDVGISGSKEKRPELDRLMADAHARRFDVVAARVSRVPQAIQHG